MEEGLFKKILLVSIIISIIGFSVYSYLQYKNSKKAQDMIKFPPWPSKCPDYWKVGDNNTCINVHNIGICKTDMGGGIEDQTMDFNEDIFKGKKGMYAKCNWARQCKTPWEGIDKTCT